MESAMNATDFDPEGWHTDKKHVKCCKMPTIVEGKEAEVYRILLNHHCQHPDKETGEHQCTGAITISENAVVARCKRCGDWKGELN